MEPTKQPKLGRESWLRIGLEALADGGPKELRAARLARKLGVTTGSFYWHFKCWDDFRSALLVYWKDDVIVGLMRAASEASPDPEQVLLELRRRILESGAHRYDAAMRKWARTDPLVEGTVRDTDALRATFLVEEFRKTGMNKQQANDRAQLIGAAWRGSQDEAEPQYRMRLIRLASATQESRDN
jgi:AcrR family transcriptional regulator